MTGTATVKLTPGPPGSAEATPAHWTCLERALTSLVPLAREIGVRLAFETHMRHLTDTLASSAEANALGLSEILLAELDIHLEDAREISGMA